MGTAVRGLPQAMAGASLLLAIFLVVWLLRALVASIPALRVQVEEPFNYGLVSEAARLSSHGFRITPRGFALYPHSTGEIEYTVSLEQPLTRWSAITLQWFGGEAGIESEVDLLGPGDLQALVKNQSMMGTRVLLPESVAHGKEIALRFTARNTTGQERLILDKLVIQAWDGPSPSFPGPIWVAVALLAGVIGVAILTPHPTRTMVVGGVLTLGVFLRYVNLLRVAMAPLDPDAQGYRSYAQIMRWTGPHGFYSAGFGEREPFFPAIVKLTLWLFGDSDLALRLLTLVLSAGVVYLGYRLSSRILGLPGGLGAGLFLSLSIPAIIESGRGLRVELETILFLSSAWLILGQRGFLNWGRGTLAGALSGALLLTRFPYAPAEVFLWALALWRHRNRDWRRWAPVLAGAMIALILVLPHRASLAFRYGDAAYDTHRTLRWIANQEFQGQPGFPSASGLTQDPYAGPSITFVQYFFGFHTPREIAWRSLRGLGKAVLSFSVVGYVEQVRAVVGVHLGWVDLLAAALGVIGLGVLACRPDAAWIPLALVLGLAHAAFVYDLGLPDYRFRMILQSMPLFAAAVAAGGHWVTVRIHPIFPAIRARWAAGTRPSTPTSPGKGP